MTEVDWESQLVSVSLPSLMPDVPYSAWNLQTPKNTWGPADKPAPVPRLDRVSLFLGELSPLGAMRVGARGPGPSQEEGGTTR